VLLPFLACCFVVCSLSFLFTPLFASAYMNSWPLMHMGCQ
jgi:hypothetical protein